MFSFLCNGETLYIKTFQSPSCIVKQGGNDGIDSEYEGKKAESLQSVIIISIFFASVQSCNKCRTLLIYGFYIYAGHLGNSTVNVTALHGAAVVKARVPAGKSRTLSIILSWYYPNRDIADERVGNYYTKIFKSSEDVASFVASHLTEQVGEIVKYHQSISPPKSIFPKVKAPLSLVIVIAQSCL